MRYYLYTTIKTKTALSIYGVLQPTPAKKRITDDSALLCSLGSCGWCFRSLLFLLCLRKTHSVDITPVPGMIVCTHNINSNTCSTDSTTTVHCSDTLLFFYKSQTTIFVAYCTHIVAYCMFAQILRMIHYDMISYFEVAGSIRSYLYS